MLAAMKTPQSGRSFARDAAKHIAVRLRHSLHVKLLRLDRRERLSPNESLHVAIEPAAIADSLLDPVQSPLPPLHARLGAQPVLQKQKLATRPKNTKHFADCLIDIVDAAQRKCAYDTIDGAIAQWQLFAAHGPLIDVNVRLLDPPLRQPI